MFNDPINSNHAYARAGYTNLGSQVCKEDSEQGFLIISFAIYYYCVDLPGASVSTGSTLLLIVEHPLNEGTHKKS